MALIVFRSFCNRLNCVLMPRIKGIARKLYLMEYRLSIYYGQLCMQRLQNKRHISPKMPFFRLLKLILVPRARIWATIASCFLTYLRVAKAVPRMQHI